jgi:uncharacterized FlaG/YvyC family protein
MNIDIDSVNSDRIVTLMVNQLINSKEYPRKEIITNEKPVKDEVEDLSKEEINDLIKHEIPGLELDNVIDGLKKLAETSEILNKKVTLRINKDINRVIIVVMEKNTNRIIKEIPYEEIQNLAAHLKQAIGVLYDNEV